MSAVATRLLDGLHPFGEGRDQLILLVSDASAAPSPAELRGEAEALMAFRAGRAYLAQQPDRRPAFADHAPVRRVAARTTGLPLVGSVLAVAASAAIGVLAYSASVGTPVWTTHSGDPAGPRSAGSQVSGAPVRTISGQAVSASTNSAPRPPGRASRSGSALPADGGSTASPVPGQPGTGGPTPVVNSVAGWVSRTAFPLPFPSGTGVLAPVGVGPLGPGDLPDSNQSGSGRQGGGQPVPSGSGSTSHGLPGGPVPGQTTAPSVPGPVQLGPLIGAPSSPSGGPTGSPSISLPTSPTSASTGGPTGSSPGSSPGAPTRASTGSSIQGPNPRGGRPPIAPRSGAGRPR